MGARVTPAFQGEVSEGKLKIANVERFKTWLATLEGKRVQVTVKKLSKNRTLSQNAYYWGVVVPLIADFCGFTPEEAHEALKFQFLRINHTKLPTVRSTASLTTAEFTDYIERIRIWSASELGVVIPDPGSVEL